MKHKLLILLLAAMLTLAAIPAAALAAPGSTGWDGDFQWTELGDGTAAVSGYSGAAASVVIPDTLGGKTVTQIGDRAFLGTMSMTGVSFPTTLTSIGDSAFSGCTWLQSVDVPGGVAGIGVGAFGACSGLKTVTLHTGLQSLGVNAFNSCSSLQSITIPDTVTSIGGGAFLGCSALESVTLPNNPAFTSIPDQLFQLCTSLDGVVIPDAITSIGNSVFNGAGITSITIPANVASIGNAAFTAVNLTDIEASPSNTHFVSDGGVLYSADMTRLVAYPAKAPGSAFTLPDTVTDISSYAFMSAWNLTSITLPDRLETIGASAFMQAGMTNIVIPKSVTSVGNSAFFCCMNLKKAVFLCPGATLGTNLFALCFHIADDGIYGFADSSAQTCATESEIPFHLLLELAMSPAGGKIYTGGRVTITPNIAGGTWSFDSAMLSCSGNVFTGLKAGTAHVRYVSPDEQSATVDIVITQADLPTTGQDFTPALWLLALAALAGAAALVPGLRRRRKART